MVVPLAGTWIETTRLMICSGSRDTSFPLRERGLKLCQVLRRVPDLLSFPLRERGLKPAQLLHDALLSESFPLRERGLKLKRFKGILKWG